MCTRRRSSTSPFSTSYNSSVPSSSPTARHLPDAGHATPAALLTRSSNLSSSGLLDFSEPEKQFSSLFCPSDHSPPVTVCRVRSPGPRQRASSFHCAGDTTSAVRMDNVAVAAQ